MNLMRFLKPNLHVEKRYMISQTLKMRKKWKRGYKKLRLTFAEDARLALSCIFQSLNFVRAAKVFIILLKLTDLGVYLVE